MKKWGLRVGAGLAGLGLLAGLYFAVVVRTPYGHRAVIWPDNATAERQPGFSLAIRPLQSVYFVDVREQRLLTVSSEGKANAVVHTDDLQEVFVRASLIWRINPDMAAEVYDSIGNVDKVLPIIEADFRDAIKEVGGLQQALDLASNLGPMAVAVEEMAISKLKPRGIEVIGVDLEDAVFDEAFLTSIKDKVIADQEAEKQQRLVAAEQAKKEQVELQAQAQELRRTRLGLTPAQYLELLWIEKWGGVLPSTVLSDDTSALVNVP